MLHTTEIAIADDGRDGAVRSYGKIPHNFDAFDKVIRKLLSSGCELHFAYEAGPTGYGLYRHLVGNGFTCIVVAPSLIPQKKRLQDQKR